MGVVESLSSNNRMKKWQRFLKTFELNQAVRVLDVGFNEKEYSSVDNYIEKYYPYQEMITAIGIESPVQFSKRYPKVKALRYDGDVFPFPDKSFDICWSNAVIEHVGDFNRQINFMKEINRVANAFYISTPNRFFPVEVHTRIPILHYLPKKLFDKILPLFGKKWAAGNYMHLLSLTDIKRLMKAAGVENYEIHANYLFGFVLDYVVIGKSKC